MKRYTIFIDGEQNVVKMSILFPLFFFFRLSALPVAANMAVNCRLLSSASKIKPGKLERENETNKKQYQQQKLNNKTRETSGVD